MISPANGTRIWLACGITDMRRGFGTLWRRGSGRSWRRILSAGRSSYFADGGATGSSSWDGDGMGLFLKRLEPGRFVWPRAVDGAVPLSATQLSMRLEGIDWRHPQRRWRPQKST